MKQFDQILDHFYSDTWDFYTDDEEQFTRAVTHMAESAEWIPDVTSKVLRIEAMDGPLEGLTNAGRYNIRDEVIRDTGERTMLVVRNGLQFDCVRNTAMPSLFSTAKISGSALGRLSPYNLSQVLNLCLEVAKGNTLLLRRGEKVSAFLSDSEGGYVVMNQNELYDIFMNGLEKFGTADFIRGDVSHDLTHCIVELPDSKERLCEKYNAMIAASGRKVDLIPAVRFCTSDTGASSALVQALFRRSGSSVYFPINQPLKTKHEASGNKPCIEKFGESVKMLHSAFEDTEETIRQMAATTMQYPLNALQLIANKVDIPQKYARAAYEDLQRYLGGDGVCSMHDIYYSMTLCIDEAAKQGRTNAAKVEDMVSRILVLAWKDYDLPGQATGWMNAA